MAGDRTQAASEKVRAMRAELLVRILKLAQFESRTADTGSRTQAVAHEEDERPVSARTLAAELGVVGKDVEVTKRRIREAVEYAREHGHMICANLEGYWLARDAAEYHAYEETRTAKTIFEFVRRKKRRNAISERNTGQGLLMEVAPYRTF